MKLALLSPAFPPDFDAIGQYTWQLSGALSTAGHGVTVLTSLGARAAPNADVRIVPCIRAADDKSLKVLPKVVEEIASSQLAIDWLVVQFNPFSFGRRGFCPHLPAALATIRRQKTARVAVMFHETMVPSWPWKFLAMSGWQRPIFDWVCRLAETVFVSTERWIPQVRRASRKVACHHLPVGSNIPRSLLTTSQARRRLGIGDEVTVLGIFGQNHPSRPLDWIAKAAEGLREPGRQPLIVYVGPDGDAVKKACGAISVIDCGVQPAESVGDHLLAMDALVSPFVDGASTRRGSLIAALQHGVPVATTRREWTDRILTRANLDGLYLSAATNGTEFAGDFKRWFEGNSFRGNAPQGALRDFHEEHFSWPRIVRDLVGGLSDRDTL